MPDEPGNHQEVSWSLNEREGRTKLTGRETNLPPEEAASISELVWKQALDALQTVVEES